MLRKTILGLAVGAGMMSSALGPAMAEQAHPSRLLWGDTHLHTSVSFDAFLNGNATADPDTAYRWAKGLPVIHPYNRTWVRLDRPLDFLVVSDHAEMMGVMPAAYNDELPDGGLGLIDRLKRWYFVRTMKEAIDAERGVEAFTEFLPAQDPATIDVRKEADVSVVANPFGDIVATEARVWANTADAAERHNEPGKFTSLIGWEWSSMPGGANLHRVVMSSADGQTAKKFSPFGSDESQYPEDLWAWLDKTTAETGAEFVAIPHNSNVSKGFMFAETTLRGEKIDTGYAKLRAKWEPVVEITQIKGDSETWPSLSPDDEFADFEPFTRYLQQAVQEYQPHEGDFVRAALKNGLKIEADIGANPFKFGVIGSTDAHTGLASADEDNFHGKMAQDSVPENKNNNRMAGVTGWSMSAAGYAGVWAKDNTREEILAAFRRREVYATTGPRIALRVFGGFGFVAEDAEAMDVAQIGYEKGVPMGGDLIAGNQAPVSLLIRAVKDPQGANLDRVQVVKGWLDADGKTHEAVYNVAWDDARKLNNDGSLPAVGNSVDVTTARYTNSIGAEELATVWTDPDFDAAQKAFYYVRVIQIPTPRHSLFDTLALNQPHDPQTAGRITIQERAYSSPIWYAP